MFFRLLLQLTQSQQTSFALEKNLRTQQEIEDKMKGFSFKEDTLLLIAEVSVHINPQASEVFFLALVPFFKKQPNLYEGTLFSLLHMPFDHSIPESSLFVISLLQHAGGRDSVSFSCRCLLVPACLNIVNAQ